MTTGKVLHIHIAPKKEEPMVALKEVQAIEGVGLEGDRYAAGAGTWSETPGSGRHLTLVAAEALAEVESEIGREVAPGETRRNITTSGIDVSQYVDRELRIGEVVVRGTRLCEPCEYIAGKIGAESAKKAMLHRSGLRCDIVRGGVIHVGDEIAPV